MRIRGRHYRTGELIDVVCGNGVVEAIERAQGAGGGWIAPGLFDLQINGCLGRAFVSPRLTIEDVRAVTSECHRHGVTGLCPTLITASREALLHGFTTLRNACDLDPALARALPCFHLEGPYVSGEDGPRGAHPKEHVRPPDRDEFRRLQEAAGGRIRLVTLAPEYDKALEFIGWLTQQNVVVAIGHTAARPARIREAIHAGARLATHLGNGSHAHLPRHDNYVWEQLAADDLWASFIPDGHHLPDALLRVWLRVKSARRLIITCDASSLAGQPVGRYFAWGQELEVQPGGKVVVPGTSFLAGSGVLTDACVDHVLRLGESTLADTLDMATARPRELLRQPAVDLVPGAPADLILFDYGTGQPFRVTTTILAGRPL